MKIAFVGKGGSGKSTLTALFFLKLVSQKENVVCFDADLNIHIPKLLGVDFPDSKSLSSERNTKKIREYLRGNSKKIASADHFYKTTPPSEGVNHFRVEPTNQIIQDFTARYGSGYLAAVGTYEEDEIGKSCYHVNLSILENILSFAELKNDDWIVVDMVAGIDAFSNTLHKQFDALFIVVEPTKESMDVYVQYLKLAKHAGVDKRLFVVGNKLEDPGDEEYISSNVDSGKYLGSLTKNNAIKISRQKGMPLDELILQSFDQDVFEKIAATAKNHKKDPTENLRDLHELHKRYVAQDYVINAVGDITNQIDGAYKIK
jgi:CO dehydrogenase maturation factor